jgi:hypothetical protein
VSNRKPPEDEKTPVVEGRRITDLACPKCLAMAVIEAHRHYATRLLFCTNCEHSWTVE